MDMSYSILLNFRTPQAVQNTRQGHNFEIYEIFECFITYYAYVLLLLFDFDVIETLLRIPFQNGFGQ